MRTKARKHGGNGQPRGPIAWMLTAGEMEVEGALAFRAIGEEP